VKPLLAKNCTACHGEKGKVKGKINLLEVDSLSKLMAKPELLQDVHDAIDAREMPPEDEPQLDENMRKKLLVTLKRMLVESAAKQETAELGVRRLNRFQYNYVLKDLFKLRKDVFWLPEKMMTRHHNYLIKHTGKMPERVDVECQSLRVLPGFKDVDPFPKDLRASHGFDNQANQLTMSPLLLDSFLSLSVSILNSPDFGPKTVGIWHDYFQEPASGTDLNAEVRKRLGAFLEKAFRSELDTATLDRYVAYALAKIESEKSFTAGMKKVTSAAMSSPMFLYRFYDGEGGDYNYDLASRLSFALWGSGPDDELMSLAKSGALADRKVVQSQIERMMADHKIERFLDTFPAQWLQLEAILGATPDPKQFQLYMVDKNRPAGLQMALEPLLLFDALFIEDRPAIELLTPEFAYRSEFLEKWYTGDFEPNLIDVDDVEAETRKVMARKATLTADRKARQDELTALLAPIRERLLAQRQNDGDEAADLRPYAAWTFDDGLQDVIGSLNLEQKGKGKFELRDGMAVFSGASYLESPKLPIALEAKTMEVWLQLNKLEQRGGGAMTVQGPGDFFDSIVFGERKAKHWISGSNGHRRTMDFKGSTAEVSAEDLVHLVITYQADGTTSMYRNGVPYGDPYKKGQATFPKDKTSVLFGIRHMPPGGNKHLYAAIDRASLYDRALTEEEVQAAFSGGGNYVPRAEVLAALNDDQSARATTLENEIAAIDSEIANLPKPVDSKRARQKAIKDHHNQVRNMLHARQFKRVPTTDPRYGGIITNAATLTMTSGPKHTKPISRGAWLIEVVFNDPPPPPPNDVPALDEGAGDPNETIREKFAKHREDPNCASCHARIDPLGFALENFDSVGQWRDNYKNRRKVDVSGTLLKTYDFSNVNQFKAALQQEDKRFARAFTGHLMRYALSRELSPKDWLEIDSIIANTESEKYPVRTLVQDVLLSDAFLNKK
jgi:mono/diheme cytochrome c family protein